MVNARKCRYLPVSSTSEVRQRWEKWHLDTRRFFFFFFFFFLFMVHYRSSYLHRILLLLLLLLRKLHAWTSLLSSALGYISNLIHLFQARHVMSR